MTEAIPDIAATLQKFNRKERYWVIRNAFGAGVEHLCPNFWQCLQATLKGRIDHLHREAAWWAVDYHLDWLLGALNLHTHLDDLGVPRKNYFLLENVETLLVKGQQEDIDLVVASGCDVVLIEAKAFGSHSNKQMRSKLSRLKRLCDDRGGIVNPNAPQERQIRLHFVLLSRRPPQKFCKDLPWPLWAVDAESRPFWFKLEVELSDFLTIGRCDKNGDSNKEGRWSVIRQHPPTSGTRTNSWRA